MKTLREIRNPNRPAATAKPVVALTEQKYNGFAQEVCAQAGCEIGDKAFDVLMVVLNHKVGAGASGKTHPVALDASGAAVQVATVADRAAAIVQGVKATTALMAAGDGPQQSGGSSASSKSTRNQEPHQEAPQKAAVESDKSSSKDVIDHNSQFKTKVEANTTKPNPILSVDDIPHIFQERIGHLPDTPDNRSLIMELTSDPKNYFEHPDSRGNMWCEKILSDGSQLWAEVRNGKIRNGGQNSSPKKWDPETGLSRNITK